MFSFLWIGWAHLTLQSCRIWYETAILTSPSLNTYVSVRSSLLYHVKTILLPDLSTHCYVAHYLKLIQTFLPRSICKHRWRYPSKFCAVTEDIRSDDSKRNPLLLESVCWNVNHVFKNPRSNSTFVRCGHRFSVKTLLLLTLKCNFISSC